MRMTKDDKAMLAKYYSKIWRRRDGSVDEGMVSHCVNRASGYIMFDRYIYVMDKPHIKTDFWFGEHTYDYDEVCERCESARKDEQYFIDENMSRCEAKRILDMVEFPTKKPYLCREYSSLGESPFVFIAWRSDWETDGKELRQLTWSELNELGEFCKAEVEKFEKRLNTYLKRYGLSKCHYGVYWADR